jgi:hypothetical protein
VSTLNEEDTLVKNIFRLRNQESTEVVSEGVEVTEPGAEVEMSAAAAAGAEPASEIIAEPMPELVPMMAEAPEVNPQITDVVAEAAVESEPEAAAPTEAASAAPVEPTEAAPAEAAPAEAAAPVSAEAPADWVAQYVIPEKQAIDTEIQELVQFIAELQQRKADLEKRGVHREWLRNTLLTGGSLPLKQAVQFVFSELGASVQPHSDDRSDLVIEFKGREYVAEVMASDSGITLADIRRLNHQVEDFIEACGRQPKGLLIANSFVGLSLDERGGQMAFPEELRLLVQDRYKFCLLTTAQVYAAYGKLKEEQLNIDDFMNELFETAWVYGNHQDYQRFKLGPEA